MGDVWMADQKHPVRRRVALKLIKAGIDNKQVVARFEAERQALAMMDHQNIAKVLDAGTTVEGQPVPKVIDFGLAKALQHQSKLTDKTLFTEFGQVVGTLQSGKVVIIFAIFLANSSVRISLRPSLLTGLLI